MATRIQVIFDCADPDRLARFYAAALGYKVQDPPEGFATWQDALKAWNVPESEWNSASAVVDPEGAGPRIYFQRLPTPKPEKNRVHIDLEISGGEKTPKEERDRKIDAEVERLKGLGAARIREGEEFGGRWVVMQDPEGNEFCVV